MATTITAVRPLMVGGSLVAVGATASVDDALARQLVFNGDATATFTDRGDAPDSFTEVINKTVTLAGGAASEAVTITGVLATDFVQATIVDNGTNNDLQLIEAKPTANTVTLLFQEDPGASGVKVCIQIKRALS